MNRRYWIVLAAAVLAAFGAVYGIMGLQGNGGDVAQAGRCDGWEDRVARLAGLNRGQVAAFQVADDPQYLGMLNWKNASGGPTGMNDHSGQTVLLNLWATWCAPCREEMPTLARLQERVGGEDFQVLPVSVDHGDADKPKAFYAETGLEGALPFRHDGTIGTFNELKKMGIAFGMPVTVLVDSQGCALGWMNGPADWASEDAVKLVGAVLPDGS